MWVNKWANGGISISLMDMVAICRDYLLDVVLVSNGTIERASSTMSDVSVHGSIGRLSGSLGVFAPAC